jgi:hypothetical protein
VAPFRAEISMRVVTPSRHCSNGAVSFTIMDWDLSSARGGIKKPELSAAW